MVSANKTIVRNTMFLYIRMLFIMLVALYTSRVILQKLGVNDYGIYQTVGGIVGLLSFINSALSSGSSRFLTYELGRSDKQKLQKTFSTTLTIHIIIAAIIVLVAETAGLWFLYNKLIIPPDRLEAAVYVFHISILTAVFTLTQVPYNASIISHEKMAVFAYIGIVEVLSKLAILYFLNIGTCDKLKLYATLLFMVQISLMLFYRFYCRRHFEETVFQLSIDKNILKPIASFSAWSLFANGAIALNGQGVLMLLNMFFSPAVVTARAISIQVNMAATQLISNFRTAVNPQIVKKYAIEDYNGSKQLLLSSTKYSYYLTLLICLPIYLLAEPLLTFWLGIVPEYTVAFVQIIIIQSLFQVFDTSFYTALYAKGRLRENALISPTLMFLQFPLIYVLFKLGYSPLVLSWTNLILYIILGLIVKPILLIKFVEYKWSEILCVFKSCLWVTLVALPLPIILVYTIDVTLVNFVELILCVLFIIFIVLISAFFIGLDRETRTKIGLLVQSKIITKKDGK